MKEEKFPWLFCGGEIGLEPVVLGAAGAVIVRDKELMDIAPQDGEVDVSMVERIEMFGAGGVICWKIKTLKGGGGIDILFMVAEGQEHRCRARETGMHAEGAKICDVMRKAVVGQVTNVHEKIG